MKTTSNRAVCVAAVLAMANWAVYAGDVTGSPRGIEQNNSQPSLPIQSGTYIDSQSLPEPYVQSRTTGEPQDYNKGSGFIGMDVQNQQGEHLGHIKDIVFDLNSQKISYAVLSTSPKAMPVDGKMLAVPLNAFSVSSDQKHLVLNADKSKVEAAAGFSSKNWPDVGSPAWGAEPFWQQDRNGTEQKNGTERNLNNNMNNDTTR